jgi:hypothetical protein
MLLAARQGLVNRRGAATIMAALAQMAPSPHSTADICWFGTVPGSPIELEAARSDRRAAVRDALHRNRRPGTSMVSGAHGHGVVTGV